MLWATKIKSPIAWKAKNFRTYKFYDKPVLEPVVSIFVYPFQKGWAKSTHILVRLPGAF
jgi:hypothetical protein